MPCLTTSDAMAPEMTVGEVASALGLPERTAHRTVAEWEERQWPRVRRERCRGNPRGRYLVDAESFDAFCEGVPPPVKAVDESTQGNTVAANDAPERLCA